MRTKLKSIALHENVRDIDGNKYINVEDRRYADYALTLIDGVVHVEHPKKGHRLLTMDSCTVTLSSIFIKPEPEAESKPVKKKRPVAKKKKLVKRRLTIDEIKAKAIKLSKNN